MNAPTPGFLVARVVKSLAMAKGDPRDAAAYAAGQGWHNALTVEMVLRNAVGASNDITGYPAAFGADLAALIRAETIIGRLPGLRRVPFQTKMFRISAGAAGAFVEAGAPIPVSKPTVSGTTQLEQKKVGAIIVSTDELLASISPAAESALKQDLRNAVVAAMDAAFIDPTNAGSDAQPASVTNGATSYVSSGSSLAQIDADLALLEEALINGGSTLAAAAFTMHPITAVFLSKLRGTGGALAFPAMGVRGGFIHGLPVITSANVFRGGSPGPLSSIALIDQSAIWFSDDDQADVSVSRAATLEMLDNPTNDSVVPTPTNQISMFQTHCSAIRCTKWANWLPVRANAVAVLTNVAY